MSNNQINYIEFPMTDKAATMAFYADAFGWTFTEWGDTYISFDGAGVDGGFDRTGEASPAKGVLIVLYADELDKTKSHVDACLAKHGGKITKDIFEFPGGKRFQFTDPNGNELAVWTKLGE